MTRNGRDHRRASHRRRPRIAGLVALTAVGIGFVATTMSLPIDDFWLTLASGQAILDGAAIDAAIPLSWTPVVSGALNPQWGAQVLLAATGSLGAALGMNAALIAIGVLVTAGRAAVRAGGVAASFAMVLVIAAVAPHLLARTQSFSIALLPVALLLLERYRDRRWLPAAYALLIALWANLHGAFVIGQVAAICAWLGALLEGRSRLLLGATAVAAAVAPLLNPVGVDLLAYAIAQPGLDLIRSISIEWQPSYPWIPLTWLFWVQAGALLAFRIRRPTVAPAAELVLLAALLVLAVSSIRHIPWFCLATAPMLAADIRGLLHRSRARVGTLPRWLTGRSAVSVPIGLAVLAVLLQAIRPSLPQGVGRVTPDEPVALVSRLSADLPPDDAGRILNEQVWGGYLAYRLGDRLQIAMDGRIEIRDRATWARYFSLMRGEGEAARYLDGMNVTWALLRPDRAPLVEQLIRGGWRQVASDAQGILLRADD